MTIHTQHGEPRAGEALRRLPRKTQHTQSALRIGSVPYLNAVPLTHGMEDDLLFVTPAELGAMLRRDELDAALVSVTEVLFTGHYDVLDGVAIGSRGAVQSVFLAHRPPLAKLREVFCDTASLTSANLVRVLLAEHGCRPQFKPLPLDATIQALDAALLIGDRALEFAWGPHTHQVWDLGQAWHELTGLPFVYAVWALRRGVANGALRRRLRQARDEGLAAIEKIIADRTEYPQGLCRTYFHRHIRYELGVPEKQGLARFAELLRKHGLGPMHEPSFVS